MLQNELGSWDELKRGVKLYVDSKNFRLLSFFSFFQKNQLVRIPMSQKALVTCEQLCQVLKEKSFSD